MAKKRKIVSKSSESSQLPPEPVEEEEQIIEEDPEEFEGEEDVEYEEYEEELEANEEEDGEEEEEEEGEGEEEEGDDEEDFIDEPLPSVLASLSKEQLITLLSEAAEQHPDVGIRVRESAEADPAHRKIFVHGLRWDTTSENLFEEFLKYGEIEDCRVVTDKATGKSKGYGFILYKSSRGAREALKEPKKTIGNRITACQLASMGTPQQKLKDQQPVVYESEYTQRKIYVSNVGAELDPKRLTAFFSKYGDIEEGPLGLDKDTGKPKGFCLFVYKTIESANRALAEPHKQFEGVTLHCQKAIDGPRFQKKQMIQTLKSQKNVTHNQQFVNDGAPSVVGSTVVPAAVQGNLMAPLVQQQQQQQQGLSLNPAALGQALTTLIAAQGAGWNLLGALGAVGAGAGMVNNHAVVPSLGNQLVQGGYGNQGMGPVVEINTGLNGMGGYGSQGAYPNQRKGRGGAGRSQRGGRPYMGP